jgi:hypothetical protein
LRAIASVAAVLIAAPIFAEELPALAPMVRSVFPHGLKKGSSAEIEFKGQNLEDARTLRFAGSGVEAVILTSAPSHVRARVTAAADAEVGTRDFRLVTPRGSYAGVFDIGSLEEIREAEPNDDPRKPQKITLPAVVNGVIENEDWDHFQFHVEAGERVAFEVMATRNGSRLDADLAILDAKGRELAWNDDYYIFGDPRLEYQFKAGGDYVARVGSLAGGPMSDYRLIAGRVPYLARTMPAGLQRGRTTEVTVHGNGLGQTTAVWLGDRICRGTILSKSDDAARVSFSVPVAAPLGLQRLHLVAAGIEAPVPATVMVGEAEEVTVSGSPNSPAQALPVRAPVVVDAAITEPRGSQYFSFHAEAGQRFEFRVDSMLLGYPLDPVITLMGSSGKRLAAADDPGIDERTDEYQLDPRLAYQFREAGTYLAAVRDAMYRGDPAFVYRLSILPEATDFRVEVREPVKTAYIGQKTEMLLRVRRFGGWDSAVEIEAEGLPQGVAVEKQVVPPKDSVVKDTCGVERVVDGTIVHLPVRADGAKPGLYHFMVTGRGTWNGRVVEHTARVDYERYAAGYFYGPMQEQQIDLTVTPLPKAVLTTPETVELEPGGSAPVRISVARYLDATNRELIIRAKSLPAGIHLGAARVAPGTKQVTLELAAAADAPEGEIPVVISAAAEGEGSLGESPSILVRVRAKTRK